MSTELNHLTDDEQQDYRQTPSHDHRRALVALNEARGQVRRMARLLLECRDALPAISVTAARLHNVDLTLADRIEAELEPFRVPDDDPHGI